MRTCSGSWPRSIATSPAGEAAEVRARPSAPATGPQRSVRFPNSRIIFGKSGFAEFSIGQVFKEIINDAADRLVWLTWKLDGVHTC